MSNRINLPVLFAQPIAPEPRAHTRPCKNCPSAHFPPDPEAECLLQQPHYVRVEHAFACGWNPKRYCRGYCDQNGVSDADLAALRAGADEGEAVT